MNYLIWAVGACLLNHRRERILREKYIVIFDFVDRIDQAVKKLDCSTDLQFLCAYSAFHMRNSEP